jgi:septal ring factor EnvC (AmiA/AmiB activator)
MCNDALCEQVKDDMRDSITAMVESARESWDYQEARNAALEADNKKKEHMIAQLDKSEKYMAWVNQKNEGRIAALEKVAEAAEQSMELGTNDKPAIRRLLEALRAAGYLGEGKR